MAPTIRIVALGGSLAEGSASLKALEIAAKGARDHGARVDVFDVRRLNLPLYSPDAQPPEAAATLAQAVHECHGMIWSSPLYHGAVSGSFKNAIDWLETLSTTTPAYLTRKVVALIGVAGGTHALQAINTMEFIARSLRAWTLPLVVPISHADRALGTEAGLKDEHLTFQLRQLGAEVVGAAKLLSRFSLDDGLERDAG